MNAAVVQENLRAASLEEAALAAARTHDTTLEAMFCAEKRTRRASAARTTFFRGAHDPDAGRTVPWLASLTGQNRWTVHSAVFHSPRSRTKAS